MTATPLSQASALGGVRILDLTSVVFGPYASQILADYGADVIKVESPAGDSTRHTGPAQEPGLAAIFLGLNRNKRSIVLDLKQAAARQALLTMADQADVLMHSMRPAKMAALGLDPDTLCARNPRLVYAGLYGFGAAAHIVLQVARWQGREVYAFSRPGDHAAEAFARSLGAVWAGPSDRAPPQPLDAAIIYAPAGELVPAALRAVRKGGRVVCAGIHMSDIPSFPYSILWGERELVSVANLTRRDGLEFFPVAARAGVRTEVQRYPLEQANQALDDLRHGRFQGAAVLVP